MTKHCEHNDSQLKTIAEIYFGHNYDKCKKTVTNIKMTDTT